jgi:hypothetical protein
VLTFNTHPSGDEAAHAHRQGVSEKAILHRCGILVFDFGCFVFHLAVLEIKTWSCFFSFVAAV